MSSLVRRVPSSGLGIVAYVVVGAAVLFELGVLFLAVTPQVGADYRAYYIDHTTTCPNQPVDGAYALGTMVDFTTSGEREIQRHLRVCGWEGPAGNGLHAIGETSRLRFAVEGLTTSDVIRLTLRAVDQSPGGVQHVVVVLNGKTVGTLRVEAGGDSTHDLPLPADLVGSSAVAATVLDVELRYPDAVRIGPNDSATRKRSIILQAGGIIRP